MLAIEINQQSLQPCQRPIPRVTAESVLIKVAAAGINRPDIMQRKGLYPPPPGASDIPGLEVSGLVIETGVNVKQIKTGDQVCALLTGGGYAEYCLANAELCLPVPCGFDFVQAAALPETFFTVWSNVFDRAQLQENETLLVHGGCSGIGTTAIQLAKAFNSKVYVTAGSKEKCLHSLELGADAAINYTEQDFVNQIQTLNPQGVNVILDMIGGDYFLRNLKCLSEEGRLVQIAVQNGPKTEANLLPIMLKRLTITGSTLRGRNAAFKKSIAEALLKNVWPLLESGKIKPVIDSTFDLQDANRAQQRMEQSQHIGKIILKVSI